jgi:hypothetical protein
MIAKDIKIRFAVAPATSDQKILAIKLIRILTGKGLKEAKDIVDYAEDVVLRTAVEAGPMPGQSWNSDEVFPAQARFDKPILDLATNSGVEVEILDTPNESIMKGVRSLVSRAVEEKNYNLSRALIDVLQRFDNSN